MKWMSTLLAVRDMEASKRFYTGLMGMQVTMDLGANVVLDDHVALQTLETWADFIDSEPGKISFGGREMELYFETQDLDAFLHSLEKDWPEVKMVCPLKTFPWGQRSVHFSDPNGHCIEVGENMEIVIQREILQGKTDEEVQEKCMYGIEFVRAMRQKLKEEGRL